MKLSSTATLFLMVSALLFSSFETKKEIYPQQAGISDFLGQWGFDIKAGGIGWLDIRQENGYIDADILYQGGSIVPATYAYVANNVLYLGRGNRRVVRSRDAGGAESRVMMIPGWLEIKKEGDIHRLPFTCRFLSEDSRGYTAVHTSYIMGIKIFTTGVDMPLFYLDLIQPAQIDPAVTSRRNIYFEF